MSIQEQSITSFDTGYSADSTEFCPFTTHNQYLACGTYQLTEEKNENNARIRKGKLYLFDINTDQLKEEQQQPLTPKQVIDTPAILDMKWCHTLIDNEKVLGVADSIDKLIKKQHIQVSEDDSVLCLSLDWSTRRYNHHNVSEDNNNNNVQCIISHSNGDLSLLSKDETNFTTTSWHAHDLEAWIAAFDYWDVNKIYSGADDMLFRGWDIRIGFDTPIFTNRRHDMGVTTMQSNPHREHVLATGSYDEHVYLWDTRSLRLPVSKIRTEGGGIWRLKWHPSHPTILLSASMHAGAFVIDTMENNIVSSFLDHQSMAYGADWSFQSDIIASCSFYDHILHLWKSTNAPL
ncbi:unnamed protein product [Cunninghamella echinulata]